MVAPDGGSVVVCGVGGAAAGFGRGWDEAGDEVWQPTAAAGAAEQ